MKKEIKVGDVVVGRINFNVNGSAYVKMDDNPKSIYVFKHNCGLALHLDLVEVKIKKGKNRKIEGKVNKVIERFKTTFVGTLEKEKNDFIFIPDNNKIITNFNIPFNYLSTAQVGNKIVVELLGWKNKNVLPVCKVINVLGESGTTETEIHSILHEYELPYKFDENVLNEAETISEVISEEEISRRADFRNVTTITIDPTDAKDFDDAISISKSNDNYEIGIHIADVSHYLRNTPEVDKEAYRRGTSVYLVDRVVPMLPERLSNFICSLRPNEDKLCFSYVATLDKNANIVKEWFGRTIINSDRRYTYDEAQKVIDSNESNSITDEAILILNEYAKKLKKARNSAISFDSTEVKFVLDKEKKPTSIYFKKIGEANNLVEEFMLLANKQVAKVLNDNDIPVVNRIHTPPNVEDLASLKKFIKTFGYDIKINTDNNIKKSLNQLLIDIKGKPEENLISSLVVRSMQKAIYSTTNRGHYGLGFENYGHFTSPIRRYPDVILHRLLWRHIEKSQTPKPSLEKLESKCVYLSNKEKKAQKAERDSIKYMQSIFLSNSIGKVFDAIVSGVMDFGIFFELKENKAEGFYRFTDLNKGNFKIEPQKYCVTNKTSGHKLSIGDSVSVVIKNVDIEKKIIYVDFI